MTEGTSKGLVGHWREWRGFVLLIVLMVLFRSAVADWYSVPTGSMKPNIIEGDRVFVNKMAYDVRLPFTHVALASWDNPKRNEVVVFDSPVDGTRLIKRVVGVPGDTIVIVGNRLFVNGKPASYNRMDQALAEHIWHNASIHRVVLSEQFSGKSHPIAVLPHAAGSRVTTFGPVTVPAGQYFMLGDNRDNSHDSRYIGFIPRDRILGRASHVVMSLNYDNYFLPRSDRLMVRLP